MFGYFWTFFFLDLRIVKVKSSKEKTIRIKSRRHEKYGGKMLLQMLVCMHVQSSFSCVWLSATLWTVACQAPLSMEFSRHEYWSGLLCPPPADLPNQLLLCLLHWQAGCSLSLVPRGRHPRCLERCKWFMGNLTHWLSGKEKNKKQHEIKNVSCLSVPVHPTHPHPTLLPTEVSSSYRYLIVAHSIYLIMSNRPLLPHHKIQTTSLTMQNTCCDNKVLTFLFTTRICSSDTIYYHSPNTPSPLVNQHLCLCCALCLPIAPDATVMTFMKARWRTSTFHQTPHPVPPSCVSLLVLPAASCRWVPGASLAPRVGDQLVPGNMWPRGPH